MRIELDAHALPYTEADLDLTLPQRFAQVVERFSAREAVWDADGAQMTYADLDAASNRVANALAARLGGTAQPVGVLMAHRTAAVAALIGIYKAGMISLVLDTQQPPARLRESLADAAAPLLLTDAATSALAAGLGVPLLPIEEALAASATPIQVARTADEPMSIYYTSGSTGKPKGVVRSARARLYGVMMRSQIGRITHDDRNLGIGSLSFSGSFTSTFVPLMSGARLHLVDVIQDGLTGIVDCLRGQAITVYFSTSTIFRVWAPLIDHPLPALRLIKLGGEPVRDTDAAHFKRIALPGAMFNVTLASSEGGLMTSITYTHDSPIPTGILPVGYPTPGKEILIVDDDGAPLPPGETGEIALRSKMTASGYLNRAELTAARFKKEGDHTLLLTGDLGRIDDAGCVYHLGRKDNQIKINGQRIELGEVEAALEALAVVKTAAVLPTDHPNGAQSLTAFVVPHDPATPPTAQSIRDALRARLTPVMIPAQVAFLTELPVNANGKLDIQKLLTPTVTAQQPRTEHTFIDTPKNDIEFTLKKMWETALKVNPISVHDDFFALGGHSLLAAQVFAQIEARYGRVLPLTAMLETPSIAKIAERLSSQIDEPFSPLVPLQAGDPARPPLFCFHGAEGFIKIFDDLAPHLGADQPVYALQAPGLDTRTQPVDDLGALVALHLSAIRAVRPHGPYHVTGYSFGGSTALAVAHALAQQGEPVGLVALLDSHTRLRNRATYLHARLPRPLHHARLMLWYIHNLIVIPPRYKGIYARRTVDVLRRRRRGERLERRTQPDASLPPRVQAVVDASHRAAVTWTQPKYAGRLDYFFADGRPFDLRLFRMLHQISTGNYRVHLVPGTHATIMRPPQQPDFGGSAARRAG